MTRVNLGPRQIGVLIEAAELCLAGVACGELGIDRAVLEAASERLKRARDGLGRAGRPAGGPRPPLDSGGGGG